MSKKRVDILNVFAPAGLSLYDLAGFVKVYMGILIKGTCSQKDIDDSKAYISELAQRLGEIKKELGMSFLTTALHKAALSSNFVTADECQTLSQLRPVIGKISRSFRKFLKNPTKAKKCTEKLRLFCEILCQKMPFEERFQPGPVIPEIKIAPSSRTNWMADGQPGEAD